MDDEYDDYTYPQGRFIDEAAAALDPDAFSALQERILAYLFGDLRMPGLTSERWMTINDDEEEAWKNWRMFVPDEDRQ